MATNPPINTNSYWDARFAHDWESFQGPVQSRFFSRLAIENLPRWLIEQLQRRPLTLADWGCAQGDGTDVWASYLDAQRITGIDFSKIAIDQAQRRYPAIRFSSEDWLDKTQTKQDLFDIIFSSNTLEHFYDPYRVLNTLSFRAKKAIVLALPFKEWERGEEHFFTFLPDNIPARVKDDFRLVWSRVVDCRDFENTPWAGDQIILVYAKSTWIDELNLTLRDLLIEQSNSKPNLSHLHRILQERDVEVDSLQQILQERDKQIDSLRQVLQDRDKQIDSLQQVLQEREGQIKTINSTLAERDRHIEDINSALIAAESTVNNILSSRSWRITKIFRLLMRSALMLNDKEIQYKALKSIYWRLPESVRHLLNRKRHDYVAKHYKSRKIGVAVSAVQSQNHFHAKPRWIALTQVAKKIAIIPCSFEFDELVNQRPINAAKYYSALGYLVLYVAWQWSPDDALTKGSTEVFDKVYQVPLYEFLDNHQYIDLNGTIGHYLITMPARQFIETVDAWRAKGGIIIYDIMDEWEEFCKEGQAPWYEESLERLLIVKADLVTAVSSRLKQKFESIRSDIRVIGNGYTESILGAENRLIAKKRTEKFVKIGYFGHLTDAWFDWELVFSLAQKCKEYQFEIIGYGEPSWVKKKVSNYDNISLIGKVLPADLHHYASQWSIGLIPFIQSDLSEAVDPIKIYEYLFFGLPVVVTGITHLKDYPNTYVATNATIVEVLSEALASKGHPAELEHFLSKTTWEARFDMLLEQVLSNKGFHKLYEN